MRSWTWPKKQTQLRADSSYRRTDRGVTAVQKVAPRTIEEIRP